MGAIISKLFTLVLLLGIPAVIIFAPIKYIDFRRQQARQLGIKGIPSPWIMYLYLSTFFFGVILFGENSFLFNTRSKFPEVRANLGSIHTAQVAYFAEHQTYASDFKSLSWGLKTKGSYYAYFSPDDSVTNTRGGGLDAPAGWPYNLRPAAGATGFTAIALGNIDNDITLDAWAVNDAGKLIHLFDDRFDEDLTHFVPGSPSLSRAEQWQKCKKISCDTLVNSLPHLFLTSLSLLLLSLIRDELRWRRAKKGREFYQPTGGA